MPKKKRLDRPVKSSEERPFEDYVPGADVSMAGLKEAIVEALMENDIDTFKGCVALVLKKFARLLVLISKRSCMFQIDGLVQRY